MKLLVPAVSLLTFVQAFAQQVPGAAMSSIPDRFGTAAQVPAGARIGTAAQVPAGAKTTMQAPGYIDFNPSPGNGQVTKILETHERVLKILSARIDDLEAKLKDVEARNPKKEPK